MADGRFGYSKHVGLAIVLLLFLGEGVLCQPRLVTFRPTTEFMVASDGIVAIEGELYLCIGKRHGAVKRVVNV